MYLAYIGFVGGSFTLLLALAQGAIGSARASEAQKRRGAQVLGVFYVLVCLGLFIGAQERNRVWANSENLWADTVEKNPTSGRAMNNLALVYMGRAEYDKAIELLKKCELHWATYMYCSLNRAISYQNMADGEAAKGNAAQAAKLNDEAEVALKRSLDLNPRNVNLNFHVARFYETVRKDDAKAIGHYRIAVDGTGGRFPSADINMANSLVRLNKLDEARASLARAIQVEPENELAIFTYAQLEFNAGNLPAAREQYSRLLKVNPRHLQGWYNVGVVEMNTQHWSEAAQAFRKTVEIDPKSEQGLFNLVFVSEKLSDGKTAVDTAKRLVEIYPEKPGYVARLKELEKKFASAH
jgi:tetratricopeptide (TPR) repeat protein